MKNLQPTTHNLQLKVFLSLVVGGWSLVAPFLALAQGLPSGQPITLTYLDTIIFSISLFFIRTSVALAIIFIVWSGITYMYAGDDSTKVTAAQGRLKSGIIGSAIILGVGVILQTIAGVVTGEFFCQGIWVPIVNICI